MGRGKGKLKKHVIVAAHEQTASGVEEKIMPLNKRGRPRKLLKKEIEEKDETKIIEQAEVDENERKRKRSSEIEECLDSVEDENDAKTRALMNDSVKYAGFRQSGSRRKNKPRRAAEVGVECYCY